MIFSSVYGIFYDPHCYRALLLARRLRSPAHWRLWATTYAHLKCVEAAVSHAIGTNFFIKTLNE